MLHIEPEISNMIFTPKVKNDSDIAPISELKIQYTFHPLISIFDNCFHYIYDYFFYHNKS